MVLIVDDDPHFGKMVATIIASECSSLQGVCCPSAEEAQEWLRSHLPVAILLDLGLPGMNGKVFLKELKLSPRTKHIPIHLISGSEIDQSLLESGAVSFRKKPFSQSDIESLLGDIAELSEKESRSVLLIEDSQEQQLAVASLLKGYDIQLDCAGNGSEGEDLVRRNKYAALIVDLGLPDANGADLIARLRDDGVALPPTIIFTGAEVTQGESQHLKSISEALIHKGDPTSHDKLLDEVQQFLTGLKNPEAVPKPSLQEQPVVRQQCDFTGKTALIHAGDATGRGRLPEIEDFGAWFRSLPHPYKIFVAGNHDFGFQNHHDEAVAALGFSGDCTYNKAGNRTWYIPWAELLARCFKIDLFSCPSCKSKTRRVLAVIAGQKVEEIAGLLGLSTDPPFLKPSRIGKLNFESDDITYEYFG